MIAEGMIDNIVALTGVTPKEAATLAAAAEPLYDAMEELGWCDSFGGAETSRTLAEALEFIRYRANGWLWPPQDQPAWPNQEPGRCGWCGHDIA